MEADMDYWMIDAIVENNPTKENKASEVNPAVA
jgi:hypothetical protein